MILVNVEWIPLRCFSIKITQSPGFLYKPPSMLEEISFSLYFDKFLKVKLLHNRFGLLILSYRAKAKTRNRRNF